LYYWHPFSAEFYSPFRHASRRFAISAMQLRRPLEDP
jgi:hypothetical protein